MVWIAGIGLFLATLDTGIINIALPTLQIAWRTTPAMVAGTVSAYTIALAGTILFWGRLADQMGPRRVFWWGLLAFGGASLLCGASWSLEGLIAARAVQGLASAMVQGTAIALATRSVPPQHRSRAVGTLALCQGLGPVIGPTVGGLLLTWTPWRSLFWINLPITGVLLVWLGRLPQTSAPETSATSGMDWFGNFLLLVASSSGLLALSIHGVSRWYWATISLLAWIIFVLWERRAKSPLIPRRGWNLPAFWVGMGAIVVVGGATAIAFMIPPYTMRTWGYIAPWQMGLVNMSAPIMLVLLSRRASRLLGQFTPERMMGIGLFLMLMGFIGLAAKTGSPSLLAMIGALGIYGVGAACFFPANLVGLLGNFAEDTHGVVGALQRLSINTGTAIDATVVGNLLLQRHQVMSQTGMRDGWLYGAITLMVALAAVEFSRTHRSDQRR